MADTLDLLTLAEGHSAINVPTSVTAVDTDLAALITAVSRRFDSIVGPVVQRTYTNELHNGASANRGRTVIRPKHTPVLSVVTLVEYSGTTPQTLTSETPGVQPSTSFFLDTDGRHNVKILRRSSGSDAYFAAGRGNILLTYLAGRVATTALVDAVFKQAAALTVLHLYSAGSAAWTRTPNWGNAEVDVGKAGEFGQIAPWDIPRAAKQLVAHEMFPTFVG